MMNQVLDLFDAFKREFAESGYADPLGYLAEVEGVERAELVGLIDAYLDRAPVGSIDEAAYSTSVAAGVAKALDDVIGQPGGMLPVVLPRLRKRAKLRRADLAMRLASELGLEGKEERIAEAYHELETGQLEAAGLRRPLLEALGQMLGESADALREFGSRLGPPAPASQSPGIVFGRQAHGPNEAPRSAPAPDRTEWDEVDELFRGGGEDG